MARKKPANTLTSAHSKPIKPSTHKPLKGKTIPDTLRVLILGAGFSKAAGFPLGNELFPEIRRAVTNQYGKENHVERDLAHYLEFHKATTGETMAAEQVDFEKLLAFLDNEHFLRLKGKDTWSSDGNESQLMIRHAIGRVLLDKTPTVIPEVYRRFARQLTPSDTVLTFNYDTLLERAMEVEGIPFRLFPEKYTEINACSAICDLACDEVVLLKLHGSIDWVDKSHYDEQKAYADAHPLPYEVKHPIFGPDRIVEAKPLVVGPRQTGDPLLKVHRIADARILYGEPFWRFSPLILSPSKAKILYSQPLIPFWRGLNRMGGLNLGLGIVGYSLPEHDDYARQAIFSLARNYTRFEPNHTLRGRKKRPIRLLTFSDSKASERAFKKSYRFLDWDRVELCCDGVTERSVDWLLN